MRNQRRALVAVCLSMLVFGTAVHAIPVQEGGGGGEGQAGEGDAAKDEEDEGEETYFAVIGGDVHTGTGAVLRGATVLARNGKIQQIGFDIDLPPDTKTLDATGLRVYPGLVAISSRGLLGNATGDFQDTADPFSSRTILGLASGITTSGMSNAVVKLKRGSLKGLVVNERPFSTLSWSSRNAAGKRSLREKLVAASAYLRKYRDWEQEVKKNKELKEPPKKGVDTAVLGVLKGEVRAKFGANERDELLGIARLAQEFDFRPVIDGCQEGWTVAEELGRAGAFAIVTPRARVPKNEELARPGGSSIENAALLYRSGVSIAVTPANEGVDLGGIVGRDIMHLPIEAGFAVRGGLPEHAALAAITIVPARILGVSHRVGSLEVGKDCDVIVTDGDVLHYETFVQYAVIDGRLVYDKSKELFFAQIRPRPEVSAPEKKIDKGETETTPDEAKDETSGEEKKSDDEKPDDDKKEEKEEKKDGESSDG